jgi:hypothetical protein
VDIWQFKIRALSKKVKGWSMNIEVERNNRKHEIVREMDDADKLGESQQLTDQQRNNRQKLKKS